MVNDSKESMLAVIAGFIAPAFTPLGFGNWRISTALIAGFMAKESVVSTLSVLFGGTESLLATLTPLTAASLLVFCLLYTPCVAAVADKERTRRQMGCGNSGMAVCCRLGGGVCSAHDRNSSGFLILMKHRP